MSKNRGEAKLLPKFRFFFPLGPETLILVLAMANPSDNPYLPYAQSFLDLVERGKTLPYGDFVRPPSGNPPGSQAPVALILSPHPDDECIVGGLPLRLMREAGFKIVNVAITLGSKVERRMERLEEVRKACDWIGFQLQKMGHEGLEKVTPATRNKGPESWKEMVGQLSEVLEKWNPAVLFFPNSQDWNQTHLGVHLLALDALRAKKNCNPFLVETEYWGQMPAPNLLVESSTEEVADLLGALSHHKGELKRNPFHLRMPSWMQDNVRRGAEVVGGQGGPAPSFDFATLYRVSRWVDGKCFPAWQGGKMLPCGEDSERILFAQA